MKNSRKINRKFLWIAVACALLTVGLVGCGSSSDVLNADEFQTIMESKGLVVLDETDFAESNNYKEILVAVDDVEEPIYSIEYYYMKNENSAQSVYDYFVDNVTEIYLEGDESSTSILKNGDTFWVTASDYCVVAMKHGKTVLYTTTYSEYTQEIKELIESLDF